jgi:hypothetical protein
MPLLTYTDRLLPGQTLSLLDIAISTSRQPRFGGHTRRWWSVLDHMLWCDELAQAVYTGDPQLRNLRLAMLLHDAHEAVTGDVPTDFKGAELRVIQKDLDRGIMGRFFPGGYPAYATFVVEVKELDHLALVTEAHIVGPPVSDRRLDAVEPRFALDSHPYGAQGAATLELMLRRSRWLGHAPWEREQRRHPSVREYLNRMSILL